MLNKPLYSIIIPHYNLPKLLRRCLQSIPEREDVQVIVVDDQSPEADTYMDTIPELKRSNVEFYVADEKKGGGHARNIGLTYAKGKYVIFSDSDDYFNFCLDDFLDDYKNSDFDCIFFNATVLDSDTYTPTARGQRPASYFHRFADNQEKLEYHLRYLFGQPWCKMVKRELLEQNKIQFEETIIHNDTLYAYMVGFYSRSIHIDNRCVYAYMVRQNSVSKQKKSDEVLMTRLKVFLRKYQFLRKHSIVYDIEDHVTNVIIYYKKANAKNKVNECYKIASEFGVTRAEIRKILLKRCLRSSLVVRIFNRIKFLISYD